MKLVDTHTHLYWDSYTADFDEIIQRAVDTDISTIINIGVDIETSQKALDQAKNTTWPTGLLVYSTIGIHPHESSKYDSNEFLQQAMEKLEQIYLSDKRSLKVNLSSKLSRFPYKTRVVGIGECGLDFFSTSEVGFDSSEVFSQKKLFKAHIDLAKKLNLPLIVHCRDDRSKDPNNSEAWGEVIKMVGNQPAILHCYSGLSQTTNYLLRTANLFVSFAANLTYPKNEYLREAVKTLPLNRILLETDSPFLAPQSKRGQRNEPSAVKEIAELIANLKGVSLEEVADQTTANANKIFAF